MLLIKRKIPLDQDQNLFLYLDQETHFFYLDQEKKKTFLDQENAATYPLDQEKNKLVKVAVFEVFFLVKREVVSVLMKKKNCCSCIDYHHQIKLTLEPEIVSELKLFWSNSF